MAASAGAQPAWAAKKKRPSAYKIIYKLNGGTNPAKQVKTVRRGKSIAVDKLRKPHRKDYVFCGWYSDSALSKRAVKVRGRAEKAGRRVFAKWEPTYYPIFYHLNGGTNPAKQVTRVKRNKTLSVAKLKVPTRRGYTFTGWYLDAALTQRAASVSGKPDLALREVRASWEETVFSIDYKLNGGSTIIAQTESYKISSPTFTFNRPMRDGFRFTGWYADSGLTIVKDKVSKGSAGNLTLYAGWSPVDYWERQLLEKCSTVNAIAEEADGAAASFVFITDMHLPSNALVSPYLVKRVIEATPASMVVFGGDALNFHTTRSNAVDLLGSMRPMFSGTEFHFVRGNHDANSYNSAATDELTLSDAEILDLTEGTNETREAGRFYYYRDDDEKRTRYLFLDSGVVKKPRLAGSEQSFWVKDRILELSAEWTVVVVVHRFFEGQKDVSGIYTPPLEAFGRDLVAVLDDVYEQADATIAGVLSGHCHRDYYERPSAKGYPYFGVATTCDAYAKVESDPVRARMLGTDDEQAFDVVTIDLAHKLVHLTRVGWGRDRCYSYAPEEPLPPSEGEGGDGSEGGESPSPTLHAASRSGAPLSA